MDSFELNKIIGAILGTLLFVMGVGFLAEAIYHPITGNGPGYALPAPEEGDTGTTTPDAPVLSIGTLLASADPAAGEASAKKCQACHDLSEASANKTGPGLYDVVERVIGSHPGFAYSAVLTEHQTKGDTWTYENLNHFLTSPKAFAPGTKMTFAGVKNDEERANIIAFLSTLSKSPKPFPPPDAASSAEPVASSEAPAASSEAPMTSSEAPAASSEPSSSAPASSESSSAAQ
ncbi:MAG: cytochrome c family protein [Devosia sp.]